MPAKSRSQQRLMGMVFAYKNGELKKSDVKSDELWEKIKKMASTMTKKEVEDFAKTKHEKLPQKVQENMNIVDFVVPDWAAAPLINDDYSSLSTEDENKINMFIQNTIKQFGNANFSLPSDDELELGFCRKNDIDSLGSNCVKLLLIPSKEKVQEHRILNFSEFVNESKK